MRDLLADPELMSYVDQIRSFDKDEDGFIRMYRIMGEREYVSVQMHEGGLHTPEGNERKEIWLSTSIKHSRQFENEGDRENEHLDKVCVAFKVDVDKFREQFDDEDIIHQFGSGQVNRPADLPDLKNLVHDELISDHPWRKLNFCLKGEANANKFNECIDSYEALKIVEAGVGEDGKARYKIAQKVNDNELMSVASSQSKFDHEG